MSTKEQKAALKRMKFVLYWMEETIGSDEPLTAKQKKEYKKMERELLTGMWDFWE